jgi:hypothetical protein
MGVSFPRDDVNAELDAFIIAQFIGEVQVERIPILLQKDIF